MSLDDERCVHQGLDTGAHALFKEKWERCKNCAYDLENNRKCSDYFPTHAPMGYFLFNKNSDSVVHPDLNKVTA